MSDDDLMKRLRNATLYLSDGDPTSMGEEAADRIEALTESRDALRLIASNKAQALILAKEENARLQAQIDAAVLAERARCATVASAAAWWASGDIAALIRKGPSHEN